MITNNNDKAIGNSRAFDLKIMFCRSQIVAELEKKMNANSEPNDMFFITAALIYMREQVCLNYFKSILFYYCFQSKDNFAAVIFLSQPITFYDVRS